MDKRESIADIARKLEVIRNAAHHNFPVGDIDRMLKEIESGYGMNTVPNSSDSYLAESR
jgi:hypothetical protein